MNNLCISNIVEHYFDENGNAVEHKLTEEEALEWMKHHSIVVEVKRNDDSDES